MTNPIMDSQVCAEYYASTGTKHQDYLRVKRILESGVNFSPDTFLLKGKVIQLVQNIYSGGYNLEIIFEVPTILGVKTQRISLSYENISHVAFDLEEYFN